MNQAVLLLLACIWITTLAALLLADELTTIKPVVVVADFLSPADDNVTGKAFADSLRLKLRRNGYTVIDRITTQQVTGPLGPNATTARLTDLATRTGAALALAGEVDTDGDVTTLTLTQFALGVQGLASRGEATFTDDTQRAKAVITTAIVEDLLGEALWTPPQVGDEAEPADLGEPINPDGDFESPAGWQAVDNVATFLEPADDHTDHATILRLRTGLDRQAYLTYLDDLATDQANAETPAEIATDASHASLAAYEGAGLASEWIPAQAGQRYWLTADTLSPAATEVLIFVNGFADQAAEGEEPDYQQVYQWKLVCINRTGQWEHFAGVLPPAGGLPEGIDVLQIKLLATWPAGEYRLDNVHLTPAPEAE
jgi:hypothetical protein